MASARAAKGRRPPIITTSTARSTAAARLRRDRGRRHAPDGTNTVRRFLSGAPAAMMTSKSFPAARAFAAVALLAGAAGASAQSTGPIVSHYTLKNGLELVVIPDHRAPVATHMIWYKVGAADETPGKSGL